MKIITLPTDERLQQQLQKKRDEFKEQASLNPSDRNCFYKSVALTLLLTEGALTIRRFILELRYVKVALDEDLLTKTCAEIEYYCETGDLSGIPFLAQAS